MNFVVPYPIKSFLCLLLGASITLAQVHTLSVEPLQNALTVPKGSLFRATFDIDLDTATVVDSNIVVFAERTGTHFGSMSYDSTTRTLIFDPDNDFLAGERVTVTLTNRIKGISGESFEGFTWHFTIQTFAEEDFDYVYKGDLSVGLSLHINASDFNNDGYPDIIAIDDIYVFKVYLYLNDQNGGFYYYGTILDSDLGFPPISEIFDYNKDGLTDIHIPGSHIFLINQGNNEFDIVVADTLLAHISQSVTADFDNDGYLDIVGSPWEVDSLCVYRGYGNFLFELDHCRGLPGPGFFTTPKAEVSDLNNDGFVDIITPLNTFTDTIVILLNDGNLQFSDPDIYVPYTHGSSYNNEYINDLNQDGYVDYVRPVLPMSDSAKWFLFNDIDGQFTFSDSRPFHKPGSVFSGGDFDADGDIDLLNGWIEGAFGDYTGHVTIFANDGEGNFIEVRDYIVGGNVSPVLFLDYDRDGDLDIVGIERYGYKLFWMENTMSASVYGSIDNTFMEGFRLTLNYPNPFNTSTQILYELPEQIKIVIKIYDLNGKEVKTLVKQVQSSGNHQVRWNGLDNLEIEVSSGIYIVRLEAKNFFRTRKIVLLR